MGEEGRAYVVDVLDRAEVDGDIDITKESLPTVVLVEPAAKVPVHKGVVTSGGIAGGIFPAIVGDPRSGGKMLKRNQGLRPRADLVPQIKSVVAF